MAKNCLHKFSTVRVENEVINHPKLGSVRREHRSCVKCGEVVIDHLAVSHNLSSFFVLNKKGNE